MKKIFVSALTLFALTGCGQSEAQEDYARCNDEFASGMECTEKEFKDFLYYEYEDLASLFGGADEATGETQLKVNAEIEDKIAEIFE